MKEKESVLLISPPSPGLKEKLSYPPLGILYLASNVDGDPRISVMNMLTISEPIESGFDIYGVSIHSVSSYHEARKVIDRIREQENKALIVVGGAFPTSMAEYTLETTKADVVVKSEGEVTFSQIVSGEPFKRIRGITYKKNGVVHENPPQPLVENLDKINFPARHLLPREQIVYEGKVHHSDKPATTIFASRGCPWSCNYCQKDIWTRKWRSRSPENIREEIESVKREYGIHWFRFPDDNVTVNKNWFRQFCGILKKSQVEWTILSRSDTIDMEMLKTAKESGCQEIFFGFESGSQRMLDLMGRRNTVEQNEQAVKMCRELGIKSCAYMMMGFPGETAESVEETIGFLRRTKPDKARLSTFLPIPGTDVWDNPGKYGVRIRGNFADYWYFDNPETGELYPFGLKYDYLSGGNKEMDVLRQEMINFFSEEGYISGWTK